MRSFRWSPRNACNEDAAIAFLHGGLLFFDNSFAGQRAYFVASRQIIGIDQAGHGHGPDDRKPLSYQKMADDVAAVIERPGAGPSTCSARGMPATSACCSHATMRRWCAASSSPVPT
jgi:pimeloyl-ACP methyl ester carboxylesterase